MCGDELSLMFVLCRWMFGVGSLRGWVEYVFLTVLDRCSVLSPNLSIVYLPVATYPFISCSGSLSGDWWVWLAVV